MGIHPPDPPLHPTHPPLLTRILSSHSSNPLLSLRFLSSLKTSIPPLSLHSHSACLLKSLIQLFHNKPSSIDSAFDMFCTVTSAFDTFFTYQAIIHGLCGNVTGDEGFRIFNELKLRGYGVDVVTYSTVIDGLGKMGRMHEARTLWVEMVKKGMPPNRYTYGAVIDGYFKCGDPEEAKKLYNEMVDIGYGESTVSCNIMINGLCLHGMASEAMDKFEEMGSKVISMDIITYNTRKLGRIAEAMRFYSGVLEAGLQPTVSTYIPLIIALCNQGNMTDTAELIQLMKDRGLEPLVYTNDVIITAFCKVGRAEQGLVWLVKMLEKNLRPRAETFNRLVEYLSLACRTDDVLPVLNTMFEIGWSLGSSVCHLLVDKLCGRGGRVQAEELFEKIVLDD